MGSIHYLGSMMHAEFARAFAALSKAQGYEERADEVFATMVAHDCGAGGWEAEPMKCRACGFDWDMAQAEMDEYDRLAVRWTRKAENEFRAAAGRLAERLGAFVGWPSSSFPQRPE